MEVSEVEEFYPKLVEYDRIPVVKVANGGQSAVLFQESSLLVDFDNTLQLVRNELMLKRFEKKINVYLFILG